MSNFPLIEQMGLKVERATVYHNLAASGGQSVNMSAAASGIGQWDMVRADELEKLLGRAPVVYGFDEYEQAKKDDYAWQPHEQMTRNHTYSGRLLCVQPIVKDSAESLLREAIDGAADFLTPTQKSWVERARKVLENK